MPIRLEAFHPKSQLVTSQMQVLSPRFPVIDAHDHLGPEFGGWSERSVDELIERVDEAGVQMPVKYGWRLG